MKKLLLFSSGLALLTLLIFLSGCTAECGDGVCNRWLESGTTCQEDCKEAEIVCGNGACEEGETVENCPEDCQPILPNCSNGEIDEGENCENCPDDVICSSGERCERGECVSTAECGNGIIDLGETSENCCKDAGCPANKKCSNNKCIYMKCSERDGDKCKDNEKCLGWIMRVSDSNSCCSEECVLKNCGDLNGEECEEGYKCKERTFKAFDSSKCCPKGECEIVPTCARGDGCTLGCSDGDPDCNCLVQEGVLCTAEEECDGKIISASNLSGNKCCKGTCVS